MNIKEVQNNVKENLKYFINGDDDFETIINKILEKLKDNGVSIKNSGYEILEFKENFSKVSFKISVFSQLENLDEEVILIVSNANFINSVINNYKKSIELYLINTLDLPLNKFIESSSDERITRNQLSYLRDKMQNREIRDMVENYLEDNKIESLEKLSKKTASLLLDKIQSKEKRNKRY
mgnify:CR=1 FL=1